MRTTVEISQTQHAALSALAHDRGLRGFSQVVQEALEAYLNDLGRDEVTRLLELEGMLDAPGEGEVRARIDAVRATWRAS